MTHRRFSNSRVSKVPCGPVRRRSPAASATSVRLLFVSSDFLPTIGGISSMVHGLAEACVDLGHEVLVLAPGPENGTDSLLPYKVIRDTRQHPQRWQRVARLLHDRRTTATVCELVEGSKPDAILLGVYKDYAQACLTAAERFHIPVGGLVHGLDVVSVLNRRPSGCSRCWEPSARRLGSASCFTCGTRIGYSSTAPSRLLMSNNAAGESRLRLAAGCPQRRC